MNPTDFPNEVRERCLLCGRQPKEMREDSSRDMCHIVCDVCGRYGVTGEVFWELRSGELPSDMRPQVSAVIRRRWEHTGHAETITTENYKELASQAPDPNDVPSKVRYLLGYIAHKSSFPGAEVVLTGLIDYPVCFAANKDEFDLVMSSLNRNEVGN